MAALTGGGCGPPFTRIPYLLSTRLASFVARRGFVHRDRKDFREAWKTFLVAMNLDIRYEGPVREKTFKQYDLYKSCLIGLVEEWEKHLKTVYPPKFPKVEVVHDKSRRRFPSVPWELERGYSVLEAIERTLNDPFLKDSMWEPMRQGRRPRIEIPPSITIDRRRDQYV
jgi:hypothetical protein